MRSDKANPIYLLHILREYSDENHVLSMHEILEKLRVLYDCEADRRTIYSQIELLQTCGFEFPYIPRMEKATTYVNGNLRKPKSEC